MREMKRHQSAVRYSLAMVLLLSTAGCAVPNVSMPKIPFVSGDEDPDKETWSEARARKKQERIEKREAKKAERAAKKRARRGEAPVEEYASNDGYFAEQDPYNNRRDDTYNAPRQDPYASRREDPYDSRREDPYNSRRNDTYDGGPNDRQRESRVRDADISPATISPYADGTSLPRRPPASATRMDDRQPQLSGDPAERRQAEPMTAERIGQMASLSTNARRSTRPIGDLQPMLRNFDRIYTPKGMAPYPTVLFFHGCEGPTRSHEEDWAKFYTGLGYAMISVDSISGREIAWEDVCNRQNLNPAERAADVFASIDYVRSLPFVDDERLVITGFSHGAATVWATLLLASGDMLPLGFRDVPRDSLYGVRAAYMFYGPCMEPWTVDVAGVTFIGENDRYIDPRDCARSARKANMAGSSFDYEIYPGATHTFDHRKPNQANREAGSAYDRKATDMAQARIKEHLARNVKD